MRKAYLAALAAITFCIAGCDDGASQAVSGTISLPAERTASLGASDTLFIVARPADIDGGPPLAVLKMVGMKFPLHYQIGQDDVLMPGRFFRGKLRVEAILRKSGIVNIPVPGDVRGAAPAVVEPGARNVDITLDVPAEASAAETAGPH